MRYWIVVLLAGLLVGCGAAAPAGGPAVPVAPEPPGPAAVAAAAAEPVVVDIPELGARSDLMRLDIDPATGQLQTPPIDQPGLAGWYIGGPRPGDPGPAVIAAHVNGRVNGVSTPGLFAELGELTAGDRVHVVRQDATVATFRVDRVEVHPKGAFPTQAVYGDTTGPELRLITCGGEFGTVRAGHYDDNVIVFASLEA